jgi:hypothetical protein
LNYVGGHGYDKKKLTNPNQIDILIKRFANDYLKLWKADKRWTYDELV